MKWICILAGTLAMAESFALAQVPAARDCPAPAGAVKADLPSGVPLALRNAIGDIALPGEPFDTTDVHVKGHKYGRYIFVWNVGARWIVATEQGGIGLHSAIFVYHLDKNGSTATVVEQRLGLISDVCKDATSLAGKKK